MQKQQKREKKAKHIKKKFFLKKGRRSFSFFFSYFKGRTYLFFFCGELFGLLSFNFFLDFLLFLLKLFLHYFFFGCLKQVKKKEKERKGGFYSNLLAQKKVERKPWVSIKKARTKRKGQFEKKVRFLSQLVLNEMEKRSIDCYEGHIQKTGTGFNMTTQKKLLDENLLWWRSQPNWKTRSDISERLKSLNFLKSNEKVNWVVYLMQVWIETFF